MNIIERYLADPNADWEQGADLFIRFGSNPGLKKDLQRGWAAYDLGAALRRGLEEIKSNPGLPCYLPEASEVRAVTVQRQPRQVDDLIRDIEVIMREDDPVVNALNAQIDELLGQRGDKANQLTDATLTTARAAGLILDCKLISEDVTRLIRRREDYKATGKMTELADQEEPEDEIARMDNVDELVRKLKQARARRSKAQSNARKHPSKRKYYEDRYKMEDLQVNDIIRRIDTLNGK